MKTLKREEMYANKYDHLDQIRRNIEEFIEDYYNRQRLHSAFDPRKNSSKRLNAKPNLEARRWSFLRTKENNKKVSKRLLGKGTTS